MSVLHFRWCWRNYKHTPTERSSPTCITRLRCSSNLIRIEIQRSNKNSPRLIELRRLRTTNQFQYVFVMDLGGALNLNCLIQERGSIFPTVYALWRHPELLPSFPTWVTKWDLKLEWSQIRKLFLLGGRLLRRNSPTARTLCCPALWSTRSKAWRHTIWMGGSYKRYVCLQVDSTSPVPTFKRFTFLTGGCSSSEPGNEPRRPRRWNCRAVEWGHVHGRREGYAGIIITYSSNCVFAPFTDLFFSTR